MKMNFLRRLALLCAVLTCGMLLALRVDRARHGPWEYRNCLTALSPTPLSDGGGYCALIGGREGA